MCAAAAVHAVGRVNFLDDPTQVPHCKPKSHLHVFQDRREPRTEQVKGDPGGAEDGVLNTRMDLAEPPRQHTDGIYAPGEWPEDGHSHHTAWIAAARLREGSGPLPSEHGETLD